MTTKPLILVDLDDTLFQTYRRITPNNEFRVASVDKSGQPLSFMKPKQQKFVEWLIQHSDLIPVTARSIDGLNRVQIDFSHGGVCSHGGTVISKTGEVDNEWSEILSSRINHVKDIMDKLPELLMDYAADLGSIRTWTLHENNMNLYSVAKQNDPDAPLFLTELVKRLPAEIRDNFYIHTNGNNLAIIPHEVSKKNAVEYFLKKHNPDDERVVLGFGDSLSDFGFLSLCDWFGMPKNSQLNVFTKKVLISEYEQKGYFGNE